MLIFLRRGSGRELTMMSGISTRILPECSGLDTAGYDRVERCAVVETQGKATTDRRPDFKFNLLNFLEASHMWTKPEYTEMRFGFEVTMYIANR